LKEENNNNNNNKKKKKKKKKKIVVVVVVVVVKKKKKKKKKKKMMMMMMMDIGERIQTKEKRSTRRETCFNPEYSTRTLEHIGPDEIRSLATLTLSQGA